MFKTKNIFTCLSESKAEVINAEESIISETNKILKNELFTEKNILANLGRYKNLDELITEEEVNSQLIFTSKEIKKTATKYRLKFLDSANYKPDMDLQAIFKIKKLNEEQRKNLKHFKILSAPNSFMNSESKDAVALFAKTNHDNYYLIHQWGAELPLKRKILYWPLRNFETLALSILLFTLFEALILPTNLITLDSHAEYWSGYRGGTFFHLLIFNSGFSAYFFITFAKNFSGNLWNRKNDFD